LSWLPRRSSGLPSALGLKAKIMVRFAAVALFLSVLLGAITYVTVRQLLLEDRRASTIEQAVVDARLVSATLRTGQANPSELLADLRPPARSTPLLHRDGEWFAASLQVRPEDLPTGLVDLVFSGIPARQTIWLRDRPVSVVGINLGEREGSYFEVFSLGDVANTMTTLSRVLVVGGAATTLAGALLGALIARRVLRPLREVTAVAQQIAAGELESRLDERLDKDLSALTASFNRMAETLQSRIAREMRFASDVAHELRTPLTTVVTSLAVLEGRHDELSPQGQEALDLLSRDVRRLEQTAADLVEIAKHDAGAVTADLEPRPAAAVVTRLLTRMRRPDLPVSIDQNAARSLVKVDERRLERVLANLIFNADTHGGGVTRLGVESSGDKILISVEDAGPGVPNSDRDRIFERFARGSNTQPSGQYTGSGLGLALAAENVRLQGGRIWVEDRLEGGARFVVELEAEDQ